MTDTNDAANKVEDKAQYFLRRLANDLNDARQRLHEIEAAQHEPVAVVGVGCRFPGGASSAEGLWDVVAAGVDAVEEFPADRGWEADWLPGTGAGMSYARMGGFLNDAADFDAGFFGISPREAVAMDPQQRLLLECAWEAVEDAGIDPVALRGSQTGVFAGVISSDYAMLSGSRYADEGGFPLTGIAASVVSGRVAYVLGLEGPAVSVDTACSSSLVALHLACQALRRDECSMALAGGITVMATPGVFGEFARQGGLAGDGRCKAYSGAADGTGFAEGAGVLVVERLSDAVRNGHRVLGVVAGSAVNQDGASNGLTAPNGPSQERVIRAALADAGIGTADVDVVEGHGTGTVLGDPIEAGALLAIYGQGRGEGEPLWLGSVKSNIGHAQAAAGVAGIIKMLMALRHEQLPATLHVDEPSPHVEWDTGQVALLTQPRDWPRVPGRVRRAGVSSFGISGTNAHVIIAEPPVPEPAELPAVSESPAAAGVGGVLAWVVSGKTEGGLAGQAARIAEHVRSRPGLGLAEVAAGLAGRSAFGYRAVVTGQDQGELVAGLAAVAAGEPAGNVVAGLAGGGGGKVALVFPGQGSQWPGMGAGLHAGCPVFAAALDEVCGLFGGLLEHPLFEVLRAGDDGPLAGLVDRADFAQAGLFAVEVALARTLEWLGIRPALVAGHSAGEITAAHLAGVFTLQDAVRLVAARGCLMAALPPGGSMTAVRASEQEAAELLTGREHQAGIAAVNGPQSVVISGQAEVVAEIAGVLAGRGRRVRPLRVSHAFHSLLMDPMLEEFAEAAARVSYREPVIPVISGVTGRLAEPGELCGPGYWVANVRQPVRFAAAVMALRAAGATVVAEAGPGQVLSGIAAECLGEDAARVVAGPVLRTGRDEPGALLAAAAEIYVRGGRVDWPVLWPGVVRAELPGYAFQRDRYWLAGTWAGDVGSAGLEDAGGHGLLGAVAELADGEGWLLTGRISATAQPWLGDHVVAGMVLVPGTALLDMMIRAGDVAGCPVVEELVLAAPLAVPPGTAVQVQVRVGPPGPGGQCPAEVHSRTVTGTSTWVRHATATLTPAASHGTAAGHGTDGQWPPAGAVPCADGGIYDELAAAGYDYGPAFRGLTGAWRHGGTIYAEVTLPPGTEVSGYGIHPALLDAALHAVALTGDSGQGGTLVPFSWAGAVLHAREATALRVTLTGDTATGVTLTCTDPDGGLVFTARSLHLRPLAGIPATATAGDGTLLALDWPPLDLDLAGSTDMAQWAVLGGELSGPLAFLPRYPDMTALTAAISAGECPAPPVVVTSPPAPDPEAPMPDAVRAAVCQALELLQGWLACDELGGSRLVILTSGAVAATPDEAVTDLAAAAVWGLARSAQSEEPGRILLADVDGGAVSGAALPAALGTGEPQLVVRGGRVLAARLVRVPAAAAPVPVLAGEGAVLVTGGTGTLGGLISRHLAAACGADGLVLVSRRGPGAQGAGQLAAELAGLGTGVRIVACDSADRQALGAVAEAAGPLAGVVHLAGVIDDGPIGSLTAQRVRTVLRAKVDAAWHLHELTAGMDLAMFVMFSSAAGVLGSPGQGNYAAANAYLDALAQWRRQQGLPGLSLAWGLWEQASGMTGQLGRADLARMRRAGFGALGAAEGLGLFDAGLAGDRAVVVAARVDGGVLGGLARAGELPLLLRALVRVPVRSAAGVAGAGLAGRLGGLDEAGRAEAVLGVVRQVAAAVLGHAGAGAVAAGAAFRDLGFDSLTAVELRNRLAVAAGVRLPATVIFDYPTPAVLAGYLLTRLAPAAAAGRGSVVVAAAGTSGPGAAVAVVGAGCRFPGGVCSPEELWELVVGATDAVGEFPADRGWPGGLYDPVPGAAGKSYARTGGFLYDAAGFDAGFFGISPREAVVMDPQQRLLLECAWEALEHAGIDPAGVRGTAAGVFAGVMYHDYGILAGLGGASAAGSVVSGRVAYTLGLEGPAVSVDTACSSSLVALHLAVASLRRGECSLALAGGVTVMATPGTFVEFSRQRGLAPDGRCKSYSAAADGVGWGEGAGLLVLERLPDAVRNGHRVLGIIAGSAVNQDGASNGLTAPNGPSQERVIRAALADAGLRTADVDVVEGHGTGTTLGDPIEAGALLATYGQDRPEDQPLWLGSVKSNIGHAQAAAGVAGIIKILMALRHQQLPATLHADQRSPHVDWDTGQVALLTSPRPWPRHPGRRRHAGISSFGISGTNAHIIITEPPAAVEPAGGGPGATGTAGGGPAVAEPSAPVVPPGVGGVLAWTISAKTPTALTAQAARIAQHVQARPGLDPAQIAAGLAARSVFPHRAVVTGAAHAELLAGLAALATGQPAANAVRGVAAGEPAGNVVAGLAGGGGGKVALVFPGQGSQWPGMGAGLHAGCAVFAAALDEVCGLFGGLLEHPLFEVLRAGDDGPLAGLVDRADFAQAGLFAVEVALARTLEWLGIRPALVAGHSAGEITAAHLAGVFTLQDAVRLVAARGCLMAALPPGGSMTAVRASEQEAAELLTGREHQAGIAAVNGPQSVVISGQAEVVAEIAGVLAGRGRRVRPLRVSHAFHSLLMDPMLEEFAEAAARVSYREPVIPVISGVTGRLAEPGELCGPGYWVANVRQPVRFAAAVMALRAAGATVVAEAGPGQVLSGIAAECLGEDAARVVAGPVLRTGRDEPGALLAAAAEIYVRGGRVDWPVLWPGVVRAELPGYAFQRDRYWLAGTWAGDVGSAGLEDAGGHGLLGAVAELADGEGWLLTGRISATAQPWLGDHVVAGMVLVPGTALLDMMIRAGDVAGCPVVEELVLAAPLAVPPGTAVQVQVRVGPPGPGGQCPAEVHSRTVTGTSTWVRHATATLTPAASHGTAAGHGTDGQWPPAGAVPCADGGIYDELAAAGYDYGPAFRGLTGAWRHGGTIYAEVTLPPGTEVSGYGIHPALLDAALHAVALTGDSGQGGTLVPFSWAGAVLHAREATALRVTLTGDTATGVTLTCTDPDGGLVFTARSLHLRPLAGIPATATAGDGTLLALDWPPLDLDLAGSTDMAQWAVLGGELSGPLAFLPRYPDMTALTAAISAGECPAPPVVVTSPPAPDPEAPMPDAVRAAVCQALELLQGWLACDELGGSRLVILTSGAVAATPDEAVTDLAAAAVWGLARSAQSEEPGRILLAETDHDPASVTALAAVARHDLFQTAIRAGRVRTPVLTPLPAPSSAPLSLGDRPVLITGGTGTLGALIVRHLAAGHGARHLILASRRPAEMAVARLAAELATQGVTVRVVAGDVSDRAAAAGLLAWTGRLAGVVHLAGVLADATIGALDRGQLERVLAPKVDGAWYLHELTAGMDLAMFVMFSSAAGVLGSPGQGNYAAANAYLDALAQWRRQQGLPGLSLAWGLWEQASGMSSHLTRTDLARINRSGLTALTAADGMSLLDAALGIAAEKPVLVPVRLDLAVLRAVGAGVPPMLAALAGPAGRRAAAGPGSAAASGLAARLAGLDASAAAAAVLELVTAQAAAVLGHAAPVQADLAFRDLGLDSLTALELRNQLTTATGVQLAATITFDYPTPAALATHLLGQLRPGTSDGPAAPVVVPGLDQEPMAVVGVGCRFPGGAGSAEELWELVAGQVDAVGGFPADRGWDTEGIFDPDPAVAGKSYTRSGGFVYEAAEFDAGFFGISPREAVAMDPQQRLLLECAWEAFENAGIDPAQVRGTQTGVFAGVMYHDYGVLAGTAGNGTEGYLATGAAGSVVSGRLAYVFGLEGPAVSVDTACSSSLVALHLACQSLRRGECSLALAGGVTVMATPGAFIEFSRQRGLAPDGRCKAYSGAADGVGWGEGVGLVLVERLSDARRLGHRVLGLVAGTAVNQDGASNGLTAPNGPSQERVIRAALADAGLAPGDVDAVEGHGTGTPLGDPIEAGALLATYGQDRPWEEPLWLGSVKSNIGHAQAAAGVAGVIKVLMALRHQRLPATLHADPPSPHVNWESGQIALLTQARDWPRVPGRVRRAGVSSFGISGTNAHVIIAEPPAPELIPADGAPDCAVPWVVSAKSQAALARQAGRLAGWLTARPDAGIREVAAGLAARPALPHRAVVTGHDRGVLLAGLAALAQGEPTASVVTGRAGQPGKTAFVFPGQGGQWTGMGARLMQCSEVFREEVMACSAALEPLIGSRVADSLADPAAEEQAARVDVVQAELFTMMVALAALWRWHGVRPQVVIGHSQGEIAAACVAGILSLDDAARVIAVRGKALRALAGQGAMAAVSATPDRAELLTAGWPGRLTVAAVNGPSAVVVAGDPAAVADLAARCEADGIRARVLPVDYASHSPQVERIRDELLDGLAGISPRSGSAAFYSAVTGGLAEGARLDAEYWYRNLREQVRFDAAVWRARDEGAGVFIEVSPHPLLTASVQEIAGMLSVGSLRRDDGGPDRFLMSLAEAFTGGVAVNWRLPAADRAELPGYAFERQRYWPDASAPDASALGEARRHGSAEAEFWAAVQAGDADLLARLTGAEYAGELVAALPVLAAWRQRSQSRTRLDQWRYRVSWKRLADSDGLLAGTWLVITPRGPSGADRAAECARGLAGRGATVLTVDADPAADRHELAALLTGSGDLTEVSGVVSLLALAREPAGGPPGMIAGTAATLALTRALGEIDCPARLWLVTEQAVGTGGEDLAADPGQAQIWGLGRVAGLESPGTWGGLADLPAAPGERDWARLAGVLADGAEDQVAIRPSGTFARRLDRAPLGAASAARSWRPHGTVLITDGTGDMGRHVARWLAAAGAPRLVLLSQHEPDPPAAVILAAELAALGAHTTIRACDITDRDQLGRVLDGISAAHPVTAVFHAAGVPGLGSSADLSGFAAKVAGAANLDELLSSQPLDAFVLFSSISATWGSHGQAGYAAANAYLDALAEQRRSRGHPATAVAWGIWAGVVLGDPAQDEDRKRQLRRRGLAEMPLELALAGLQQALDHDDATVVVADVDWDRFIPLFTSARAWPLLSELPGLEREAAPDDAAIGVREALAQRLSGLAGEEATRVVEEVVLRHVAAVLGHSAAADVQPERAFRELGFESVSAVELRNQLAVVTGLDLSATLVFDHPTPRALAEYLHAELGRDSSATSADAELGRLESYFAGTVVSDRERPTLATRLRALLARLDAPLATPDPAETETATEVVAERMSVATDDEIFAFIDEELGGP